MYANMDGGKGNVKERKKSKKSYLMATNKERRMKSNVKLLLDFAKGVHQSPKRMRIYSVIDGKKKLINEFPTDAPVSINVDVYAVNEGQLEMQIKNESLNKSL